MNCPTCAQEHPNLNMGLWQRDAATLVCKNGHRFPIEQAPEMLAIDRPPAFAAYGRARRRFDPVTAALAVLVLADVVSRVVA